MSLLQSLILAFAITYNAIIMTVNDKRNNIFRHIFSERCSSCHHAGKPFVWCGVLHFSPLLAQRFVG